MGIGEQFELEKTGRIMPESWGKEQKMDLSKANTNDLKEELERREREEARIPKPLEVKDFGGVVNQCKVYISYISGVGFGSDDIQEYIFEAAIEAVYGKNIWEYVNSKLG